MKTFNIDLHKLLLLPMLVMAMSYANAQDEKVFVTEGKTWICDWIGEEVVFKITGDTIIDNETYKKMYRNDVYYYGVRQEGQKVYCTKGGLVYDFGLNEGDIFEINDEFRLYVSNIDTINVNGIEYRRLNMHNINEGEDLNDYLQPTLIWVEGIGVHDEPINPYYGWSTRTDYRLKQCVYNGKCIFTDEDFSKKNINDIDNLTKENIGNAPVYDLSGRRLNAVPQRGLYIQGGNKRIVK